MFQLISFKNYSLFNMKEVHAVIDYIKELLELEVQGKKLNQSDIGVVVSYKLQSKIIKRLCSRLQFDDIAVGTAEYFQGQEKPVMIVSTVRTDGNLGFLTDTRVCVLIFNCL